MSNSRYVLARAVCEAVGQYLDHGADLDRLRFAHAAWDADRKPRIKNGPTAKAADPAFRAIAADMSLTSKQAAERAGCHYNTIRAVRRALRESKGLQAKKTGV